MKAPTGAKTYLAIFVSHTPGNISLNVDLGFKHWKEITATFPQEDWDRVRNLTPGSTIYIELVYASSPGHWRVCLGEPENLFNYSARMVGLYDGDTVYLDIEICPGQLMRNVHIRLSGIDTPEMRGAERPEGLVSKQAVLERLEGKPLLINTEKDKTGKYGRYLAWIWESNENINKWLVDSGLAKVYGE